MLRRYAWDHLYDSLYLNRYIVYNIFTCVNEAHLSHDVTMCIKLYMNTNTISYMYSKYPPIYYITIQIYLFNLLYHEYIYVARNPPQTIFRIPIRVQCKIHAVVSHTQFIHL